MIKRAKVGENGSLGLTKDFGADTCRCTCYKPT